MTQRGLYTERLLRTEVFTRKLYTEKLLHREASKQSIFYTQKHLRAQQLYIHTEFLHTNAFTHRSLFCRAGFTQSSFDTQTLLHRERPLHRATFTILCAQKLLTRKCPSVYADRSLHIRYLHKSSSTQMRQMLLRIQAFEHRCLYTQKLLCQRCFDIYTPIHTEAFRHRWVFQRITEALTQRSVYNRESLIHRSIYTHTSFTTEAFAQRSF